MARLLNLRGVDHRLIERLRDCGAPIGLGPGELARALLIAQLGKGSAPAKTFKRRKPIKA